jgi:hypothetical protein
VAKTFLTNLNEIVYVRLEISIIDDNDANGCEWWWLKWDVQQNLKSIM